MLRLLVVRPGADFSDKIAVTEDWQSQMVVVMPGLKYFMSRRIRTFKTCMKPEIIQDKGASSPA